MKQMLFELHFDAVNELRKLKKDRMRLSDRIAYEKALVMLAMIEKLLRRSEVISKLNNG